MENKYHIVILKEENFPNIGLPQGFSPEWLGQNLPAQEYHISYFNMRQLLDRSFLNVDEVDLLILPYGEAFPLEAFSPIKDYIEKGGGLFSIAGKPFGMPMKKIGNKWREVYCNLYQSEVNPVVC